MISSSALTKKHAICFSEVCFLRDSLCSVNVLLVGKFLMALFLISCGVIALVLSSKLIKINILMRSISIHSVSSPSSGENDSELIWENWNL
ncbi:hypothetical protein T4A_9950 [Trichinella pseudospiralis]|uniref:Uncharacterized protein n=1 Tax=Trichinella pseudospiralis TaxID=6337 RepID=A0A0V1DVM9_TRIPS|nr:hypothetical protein T4A_9950 [Trichinella pseudospiralis]KRZ24209.1 hypothetical protein T4C_8782 [Trichinella pseudospiralis]